MFDYNRVPLVSTRIKTDQLDCVDKRAPIICKVPFVCFYMSLLLGGYIVIPKAFYIGQRIHQRLYKRSLTIFFVDELAVNVHFVCSNFRKAY